ncbi:sulfate/molybdate ABC transporter ATP-binding protein [Gilliamella sp. ESL0405]|uniref:sulfate/molybdate ABC transporter ATP-binding protein n=1 Tax=Gilliamella sp. ESL0405 TaxID=2704653 RepID=UPI001C6A148B|nr:sulfate/molybdate ABC transporter ATP-binding protein [Gilliamella sp. ESL0405]QYN47814.1 sulfate/molybdate ABC transporter ATP-binding protein [Gilliamella sp. ESL0405]
MSITLHNINKSFEHVNVLENINFSIKQGELVALLGPSGCGKTTLLRIIAGLETASSGQIYFADREVTKLSAKQREIGFVFQNYALFRHMNVAENVAFGLKMKPRSVRLNKTAIDERVNQLLELVQLDHFAKRYPDQLSGGQRQRVALARALASKPNVLLLDEPFSALDAKVRKDLRRWLRDFHHELNVTSIFVTHDQEEALEVADRIILMNQGHIEQIGTPAEVYKQPKTAFVAHFLGDVNLLYGYIENNTLIIGDFHKDMREQGTWPDQSTIAYVRPHEISIAKIARKNDIQGEVVRIHTAGPTVFLEIAVAGQPKHIDVSISYRQYEQQQVEIGDTVYWQPALVNIFMQDELLEFMI